MSLRDRWTIHMPTIGLGDLIGLGADGNGALQLHRRDCRESTLLRGRA